MAVSLSHPPTSVYWSYIAMIMLMFLQLRGTFFFLAYFWHPSMRTMLRPSVWLPRLRKRWARFRGHQAVARTGRGRKGGGVHFASEVVRHEIPGRGDTAAYAGDDDEPVADADDPAVAYAADRPRRGRGGSTGRLKGSVLFGAGSTAFPVEAADDEEDGDDDTAVRKFRGGNEPGDIAMKPLLSTHFKALLSEDDVNGGS